MVITDARKSNEMSDFSKSARALHVGSILHAFLFKRYKYKKRLLLRCKHHFKADLINKMDDMRISGTEPSSLTLSQKRDSFKSWKVMSKNRQKQDEAKRDDVINPQNYNFNHF